MKSCVRRNLCACNRVCKQAQRARANVLRGRDACPQRSCARCLHARAAPLCAIARAHAGTIRYEPWRGHAQAPWTEPIRPRRLQLLRHSLAGDLERAWRERGPAQGKSAKA